jgi:hypothetical protein
MSRKDNAQVEGQVEEQVQAEGQVEEQVQVQGKLTEEQKKANKAKANKAWADRRKEAKPRVVQFLRDNKETLGPIYDDLSLLVAAAMRDPSKSIKAKTPGEPSINEQLRAMLEAGPVSEMDIFKKFRLGEYEMRVRTRGFILAKDLTQRIWVKYNPDTGEYFIAGKGEAAPEGWDGYLPPEKAEL